MYMDDAIKATLQLMDAPSDKLSVRGGYNLPSLTFTAKELYDKIEKRFRISIVSSSPTIAKSTLIHGRMKPMEPSRERMGLFP